MAGVDPQLCVDFFYGGASPAFFDFAAKNRALVASMAQAGLDAVVRTARRARSNVRRQPMPISTSSRPPSRPGLDAIEIGALLDGKAPDPPLPDQRMCEVGRTYLDVMQALPDDPRLKIYALAIELGARS